MSNKPLSSIKVAGAEARPLSDSDPVQLSCGSAGCSSNCCKASAPIVLNPYEIAMICKESGMSYEDLLDIVETDRAQSFPLVMLPRNPACHFWTDTGCRIYNARPLACRLFPLGRLYNGGRSYLVLPERNICTGLAPFPSKTVAQYLRDQDTSVYIEMADQWIEFVNEIELLPLQDKPVTSVAFHMLVYSPDTPPAPGNSDSITSPEARFLLRLSTAKEQLPRFLRNV
ncbi:MAG: YkgJ family cysteine cluster protein [Betaproteobacteria bacterium]